MGWSGGVDKLALRDLYECQCPDCGGNTTKRIVLSATENNKLEKAFNKVARWVYTQKKTEVTAADLDNKKVQGLANEINSVLQDAIKPGIAYEIPNAMLQHMRDNLYVFSGCKTFDELQSVSKLLLTDKGEIKPFGKFYKDVRQVHETYNKSYLESEYLFATQSAQMASKWADFEADGDEFNLQYRTANDDRVRYAHQVLHDTTLPPSDPFWSKFFPPNGWRCRCNVVQVLRKSYPMSDSTTANDLGEKATYTIGAGGKNTSEMFRFNPGKEQTIFPATHPYLKNKEVVNHLVNANEVWADVPTNNGKVRISSLHGKTEAKDNKEIAAILANNRGYEIDLLAKSDTKKTADSFNKTLNITQEYKVNRKPTCNAIDGELRKAASQADNIVLRIDSDIKNGDLRNAIKDRVNRKESIQSVTIIRDGVDKVYNRADILNVDWDL